MIGGTVRDPARLYVVLGLGLSCKVCQNLAKMATLNLCPQSYNVGTALTLLLSDWLLVYSSDNFLRLNIYVKQLTYEHMANQPAYDIVALLSKPLPHPTFLPQANNCFGLT